ncbi:quinol monooxygenase YgiN [Algoriphagus iocasae]|uniref:Quinol monooxygenase YgiN n=1 Tax=Algoriphagus iocasae TaxID=1836499 RepID=A0A841MIT8_9BACT|nr:antibiotic biosynthesis monooxygenase [Algoriphagus iocasae]MBB6328212.1 quinol monooxygenase YgiN [Algoriphagus iocasae]
MKKIHLIAKFEIHPGKEEEFKSLIPKCIEKVKANETGAERYEWYLNSEGTVCQVLETYSNSDAVLAHMGNVGELLGQLTAISDFTGDIYGNLSEELKVAIAPLPAKKYILHSSI